jgi:ATP-binding cassette subfamily C protein
MKAALPILRDVFGHNRHRLPLLLLLLIAAGLTDGLSMALIYPLLEAAGIGASAQPDTGILGMAFRGVFESLGIRPTLLNVSAVLIASFLVHAVLYTMQNWLLLDIQKKYIAAWQRRLVSDFVTADWPYFVSRKSGDMVNSVLVESLRVGAAFFAAVQMIVAGVILCVYLAIALVVSWRLTLWLLAAAGVMVIMVQPIRHATRRYGSELGDINAGLAATLNEMLGAIKLIKASAAEAKAEALIGEHIERLRRNLTWGAFLPSTIRSVFEFGAIAIVLGALLYGLNVEQVGAAQLLLLIALVARLLPRLMQVQVFHNLLNLSAPSFSILKEMHERFASHRQDAHVKHARVFDLDGRLPADLTACDVTLRYGETTVLDRVSFVIPAGQVVGLVGRSGAGKTTVIDLLIGLIEPNDGEIKVGDLRLRDIDPRVWRRKLGYVSQDTFLFHDTIANNIRWNRPDASLEAVQSAARAAGLENFIATLPRGYDTVVGDRGARLSGGQRQRISLARALVHCPALLVLDEATSALDSLSEQEIMGVLSTLRGTMSIVVVAHRLSTVRHADLIYVLDEGRIVEQGTWETLSGQKALFHRLIQAQAVGEPG